MLPRPALPLVLLLALAGCASSGDGIAIGDKTLEQFKAGESTENWVLAILGEPSGRSPVAGEENTEVLRYTLSRETGGIFAKLFGRPSVTVATVYFVLRDGVVTSFWADRQEEPGLLFGSDQSAGEKSGD
jgi:hypothetical protein